MPFLVITFLPGKRLSFLAFIIFISYSIYAADSATNYWNGDRFGLAFIIVYSIRYSAIFGLLYKLYKLGITGKLKRQYWSWVDGVIPAILLCVLGLNYFAGYNGICLTEGRKLTEQEIVAPYIKNIYERNPETTETKFYYSLGSTRPSFFGSYRMSFTYYTYNNTDTGTDRDYTQTSVLLDACGHWIGDSYGMGYSKKEMENKHYIDLPPKPAATSP